MSDKKNFFVIGLGKSGKAVTRLLAERGFMVTVFDDDTTALPSVFDAPELDRLRHHIELATADNARGLVGKSDCLVVSPGVPLDHTVVEKARKEGIEVTGELEVAHHWCSADIIAVTGTNGKSTVVSLLGDILQAADRRHVVAGNIGTPLSSVISDARKIDIAVLEVSSFQLDTISDFRSRVAVLLNVTPDHLDRYDNSFKKYAESKARILRNADEATWFVYNDEDTVCRRIAETHVGKKFPFGTAPVSGDGVYVQNGSIVRSWRGKVETVLAVSDFSPVGIHNLENAMAAVAAVTPFDVEVEVVGKALKGYRALAHRMELSRVVGGVAYINDSKATNVDATIKSVRSIEGKVVLIAGGLDKEGDYRPLAEHLADVRRVILIGQASEKIEATLQGSCEITRAKTMAEAVGVASEVAQAGDTVLLAPACASFDMFDNYAERGEAFKAAVSSL